jgi:hypothetical protein
VFSSDELALLRREQAASKLARAVLYAHVGQALCQRLPEPPIRFLTNEQFRSALITIFAPLPVTTFHAPRWYLEEQAAKKEHKHRALPQTDKVDDSNVNKEKPPPKYLHIPTFSDSETLADRVSNPGEQQITPAGKEGEAALPESVQVVDTDTGAEVLEPGEKNDSSSDEEFLLGEEVTVSEAEEERDKTEEEDHEEQVHKQSVYNGPPKFQGR